MTAPTPQRAATAEERDRLQGDLGAWLRLYFPGLSEAGVAMHVRSLMDYDSSPLAPLLDRITAAEARAEEAEKDAFALAANQCEGPMVGDDRGHFYCAKLRAATSDRDRLADEVATLKKESVFLLARLDEFESDNVTDDTARDWYGHVRPSMARLTALTVTGGTTDGQA